MIYHKVLEKSSGRHYVRAYSNGNSVFHRFKAKTHRWGMKYGPYGVIEERSGSATFYNLGGTQDIGAYEILHVIDPGTITLGYNY